MFASDMERIISMPHEQEGDIVATSVTHSIPLNGIRAVTIDNDLGTSLRGRLGPWKYKLEEANAREGPPVRGPHCRTRSSKHSETFVIPFHCFHFDPYIGLYCLWRVAALFTKLSAGTKATILISSK
ncbi:hypothetical protein EVAR_57166_1 [Eumeta japonica]|uniref:Uncharacterized protein n=1 Tax=Eumeta variegata TaxID=151549 RepID=A0A4C1ZUN8_EUMVA|nr:hypothetical protein EVAR_57166_1 [Eumeta japonica]